MSRVLRVGSFWRLTALIALMVLISLGAVRTTSAAGGGDGTGGGHGHGQHRGQQIGATPSQPGANPDVATPWVKLSPAASPPDRHGYALATDLNTGHVIMFGGQVCCSDRGMNDTWVWDGTAKTWTQVVGAPGCTNNCLHSPPVRYGARMAYDPTLKTVILFGGVIETSCCPFSGTIYNDTWSYDDTLQTWAQIAPSASLGCTNTCPNSPSPRMAVALSSNATTGHPLLLGGSTAIPGGCFSLNDNSSTVPGECAVNDIWSFTGTGWTQVLADTPGIQPYQRASAALAANTGRKGVVLFGGLIRDLYDGLAGDTLLNSGQGAAFIQIATNPHPFARSATGMAATTLPQTGLMIFSGRVHDFLNSADTWVLTSSNTWVAVCGTQFTPDCGPAARDSIQLATDPATGTPMFFGGSRSGGSPAETWRFGH